MVIGFVQKLSKNFPKNDLSHARKSNSGHNILRSIKVKGNEYGNSFY